MSISTARYAQPSTGTVNKIAEVTFSFWILKILATTLGESTGDLIAQTLNLGYVAGLAITGAALLVILIAQVRATRYHPLLFWLAIVGTTTAGTEISDMMDRTLGLGYLWGSVILTAGLLISLYVWYRREGNLSVDPITRRDAEIIFWIAVLFSNSLGTAFGDFLVDNLGLGYMAAAALCTAIIAGVMVLHYTRSVNDIALFWIGASLLSVLCALTVWNVKPIGLPFGANPPPPPSALRPYSTSSIAFQSVAPSSAPFMINYRVADLASLLQALRDEGCNVLDKTDDSEYGKFGWVMDPEGNKVELWQPPAGQ